ncbi:MFS transporter [Tumebacillus sp. ITR2]|uniref:MFS transporter n=1 Tax=Tumebacillus amylolyticus TaxID=2801339 RepID=A0ABS1JGP6_9BACL|nr:MFS transporter [Tumebacillus amylolyticus]MBL0388753.1 MFS transporter [Tumebacillus amylolyticus]
MAATPTNSPAIDGQPTPSTSVWKNRNFLILFLSSLIISLGGRVYELALPLILYNLTHSPVAMGAMRAIELLPNMLLAIFIGVIVDRVRKKSFMQISIALQIVFLVSLFTLIQTGHDQLAFFFVFGFFLMTFNYAYDNVRISIVKNVIPSPLLTSANAKFSLVSTLVYILGPSISGFLFMLSDLHMGLLITASALTFGLIASFLLQMNEAADVRATGSFKQNLIEGWTELRTNKALWTITMFVIFINAIDGLSSAMIPFYAQDTMGLSSSELGMVFSAVGIGGFLASLIVARVRKMFSVGHLLGITMLLMGLSYLTMYFSTNVWMMMLAMFMNGFFGTIQAVCVWSFRQETTPSHLMGRVSGITGSLFKLGIPFTMFGSGLVTEAVGPSYVFLAAACSAGLMFLVYRFQPLWKVKA